MMLAADSNLIHENIHMILLLQLLKAVLIGGARGGWQDGGDGMEAEMEVPASSSVPESLSELGHLVLGCDAICQSIVTTLLK